MRTIREHGSCEGDKVTRGVAPTLGVFHFLHFVGFGSRPRIGEDKAQKGRCRTGKSESHDAGLRASGARKAR